MTLRAAAGILPVPIHQAESGGHGFEDMPRQPRVVSMGSEFVDYLSLSLYTRQCFGDVTICDGRWTTAIVSRSSWPKSTGRRLRLEAMGNGTWKPPA